MNLSGQGPDRPAASRPLLIGIGTSDDVLSSSGRWKRVLALVPDGWLACLLAVLAALPCFAEDPVVIVSKSKQFTVRGKSQSHIDDTVPKESSLVILDPSLLAVTAESLQQTMVRELGWNQEWKGRIYVDIKPTGPDSNWGLVHSVRSPEGWNYHLTLPGELPAQKLIHILVEVLLVEYANRNGGTTLAEFPPWLVPGMTAHIQSVPLVTPMLSPNRPVFRIKTGADILKNLRDQLRTNAPLTVDQLNWPNEEQLNQPEFYEANSHLFVRELLRLKDGRDCMRNMLTQLPKHLNWHTGFIMAFQPRFERMLDVEKWWALTLVNFTGHDPSRIMSLADSRQKLDEVLFTAVTVRLSPEDLPHNSQVSLQTVISEWEEAIQFDALRQKIAQLYELENRTVPEMVKLVSQYRMTLEEYLSARQRPAGPIMGNPRTQPQPRVIVNDAIATLNSLDFQRQKLWSEETAPVAPVKSSGKTGRAPSTSSPKNQGK